MNRKPILLVVGQNPSKKDPFGALTELSQSGRRFRQWMGTLDPEKRYELICVNARDGLEMGEGSFTKSEELSNLYTLSTACIALGSYAANAMAEVGSDYWILPHPSGLNRQINDVQLINNKLESIAYLLALRYDDYVENHRVEGYDGSAAI